MKKEILASLVNCSGAMSVLRNFVHKKKRIIPILAYHGIRDNSCEVNPSPCAISATQENFAKQLSYIKGVYRTVTFPELLKILSNGAGLDENLLIITFDDGYKNNYDVAFPILKEFGLTATIFVSTGYLDRGENFWFEKLYFMIKRTRKTRIKVPSPINKTFIIESAAQREETIEVIKRALKDMDDADKNKLLDILSTQLQWESCQPYLPRMVLNWEEAAEMSDYGIEIASHTVTHPLLTKVSSDFLQWELSESKKVLEERLNKKVVSIAYPNGSYDERVKKAAKDAGYSFGLAYDHGLYNHTEEDRFEMSRIIVEEIFSMNLFKLYLIFPSF